MALLHRVAHEGLRCLLPATVRLLERPLPNLRRGRCDDLVLPLLPQGCELVDDLHRILALRSQQAGGRIMQGLVFEGAQLVVDLHLGRAVRLLLLGLRELVECAPKIAKATRHGASSRCDVPRRCIRDLDAGKDAGLHLRRVVGRNPRHVSHTPSARCCSGG